MCLAVGGFVIKMNDVPQKDAQRRNIATEAM